MCRFATTEYSVLTTQGKTIKVIVTAWSLGWNNTPPFAETDAWLVLILQGLHYNPLLAILHVNKLTYFVFMGSETLKF